MGEIKSAFEKAMEKAEQVEKASPEQLKRMEYAPQGNAIGARYVRGAVGDLLAEVSRHDAEVQKFVVAGIRETLMRNLSLPRDPPSKDASERAIEGLLTVTKGQGTTRQVCDQLKHLFTYYEGATQQEYLRLKQEFAALLSDPSNALAMQLGAGAKVDVERLPQFQEQWLRLRSQLDVQYERALQEHKQQLLSQV